MENLLASGLLICLLLYSCPLSQGVMEGQSEPSEGQALSDGGGADGGSAADLRPLCLAFEDRRWMESCGAIFSGDMERCEDLIEHGWSERCGAYVAAIEGDPSLCSDVKGKVRGMDESGKVVEIGVSSDCYDHAAQMMGEGAVCADAGSESGCRYRVGYREGSLDPASCKDADCLLSLAWLGRDQGLCAQAGERYGKTYESMCQAMLQGSEAPCKSITDMDYRYACIGRSRYLAAMPSAGVFEPDRCGSNTDCQRDVLTYMVSYAASGS